MASAVLHRLVDEAAKRLMHGQRNAIGADMSAADPPDVSGVLYVSHQPH